MSQRPNSTIARIPDGPGVYRFRDGNGSVLYLGRATSLRQRVASYWSDLGGRAYLARMVSRIARVEAVACESPHEAAWLERNLLAAWLPRWNRSVGGQEVIVHLEVDPRQESPGIRVVHRAPASEQVRVFGPYLGGLRVRQAVSGLHRILPLAYSSTKLRGGELAIARKRGVAPADRPELVGALTAILDRDPAAVAGARADLERRRFAAAEGLAFELAGQVHEELQALDWITSPQRVASSAGGDFAVHGWAGGLLARFGFRGGRLCEWVQRPCSAPRAAARVASTPASWTDFAQRNAEVAAALAARCIAPQSGVY
jgi:excinuclease ABC subunit C